MKNLIKIHVIKIRDNKVKKKFNKTNFKNFIKLELFKIIIIKNRLQKFELINI